MRRPRLKWFADAENNFQELKMKRWRKKGPYRKK
jgi:hypothetical protein